jgi:hypothetical protein
LVTLFRKETDVEGQLWERLYSVVSDTGKRGGCSFARERVADRCVALVYLWAALHDRPTVWACDARNWPGDQQWRPLPSQSTMSKRLRTVGVLGLLSRCEAELRDLLPRGPSEWLDAKPLPVGGASKDRDARAGRCVRGKARGYKVHGVLDARGRAAVDAWTLASMADNEKRVAPEAVPAAVASNAAAGVAVLYVAADNEYDGNDTYDMVAAAAEWAPQLVTSPRKSSRGGGRAKAPGHRRQSPRRLRSTALAQAYDSSLNPLGRRDASRGPGAQLLHDRGGIERRFGLWGNFGGGLSPLPNWVRTPHRVALWVQAKILILMAWELRKRPKPRYKSKDLRAA